MKDRRIEKILRKLDRKNHGKVQTVKKGEISDIMDKGINQKLKTMLEGFEGIVVDDPMDYGSTFNYMVGYDSHVSGDKWDSIESFLHGINFQAENLEVIITQAVEEVGGCEIKDGIVFGVREDKMWAGFEIGDLK